MLIEWKTAIKFTYGIRLMCKRKFSTMLSADDQVMLWSLRRSQIVEEKLMSQSLTTKRFGYVAKKTGEKYYAITLQNNCQSLNI